MSSLRTGLRRRRRELSPAVRARAARAAARHAAAEPAFVRARRLAAYLACGGELDPLPLLERALVRGKRCYLPVLHPLGHNRLWFAPWRPGDPLRSNRYGIPEPIWRPGTLVPARALDLVLVPLVAFDGGCRRLGMGGGYYDRTLAWRLSPHRWRGPCLMGYAYAFQQVARLPLQPWDVPLDLVLTEIGVACRSGPGHG